MALWNVIVDAPSLIDSPLGLEYSAAVTREAEYAQ